MLHVRPLPPSIYIRRVLFSFKMKKKKTTCSQDILKVILQESESENVIKFKIKCKQIRLNILKRLTKLIKRFFFFIFSQNVEFHLAYSNKYQNRSLMFTRFDNTNAALYNFSPVDFWPIKTTQFPILHKRTIILI